MRMRMRMIIIIFLGGIIDENDSHMQQLNEVFLNIESFVLQPE